MCVCVCGGVFSLPGPVAHSFTSNPGYPVSVFPALAHRCVCVLLNLALCGCCGSELSSHALGESILPPSPGPDCNLPNSFKKDERSGEMAQQVKVRADPGDFHSQCPRDGEREPTPSSCPLSSICMLWHIPQIDKPQTKQM